MSLGNVSNLIDLSGLQNNDYVKINSLSITSLPPTRIIGDLEIASSEIGKINGSPQYYCRIAVALTNVTHIDLSLKKRNSDPNIEQDICPE